MKKKKKKKKTYRTDSAAKRWQPILIELPPEVQDWVNQLTTVKDTYKKT